jgi:hypothetical protein
METIIRIKREELTPDLLQRIKALFKNDVELEIAIKSVTDFGLTVKESSSAYKKRVNMAIGNIESNNETITLSVEEFEELTNDLLKQ